MGKFKNSDKGYTLVELLVAMAILVIMLMEVYAVMTNSSTIYRKGNYEVQLQTEAQQVVQQLEDLMVDCNGSIEYVSANKTLTISSNVIDPSTNAATSTICTIKYEPANPGYGVYFGTLTYQKTGMPAAIPFADYVEDFDVDMSSYTNDNVTVYIKFKNEDYSYTAAEDIYLRNEIGSGGSGESEDTTSAKKFIDVKRYAVYNLDTLFDETIDGKKYDYDNFYFIDASSGSKKSKTKEYEISDKKLSIMASYNEDGSKDKEFGPYMIYATGTVEDLVTGDVTTIDDTNPLEISAHTDPVSVGLGDCSFYFLSAKSASFASTGLTEFKGISLKDAESIKYSYMLQSAPGYHYDGDSDGNVLHTIESETVDDEDTGTGASSQGASSSVIFYYQTTKLNSTWKFVDDDDDSTDSFQIQLPALSNYVDAEANSIVTYNNKQVWDSTCNARYTNTSSGMLAHGHKFYIQVDVTWPSPGMTQSFKIYLYPTDKTLTDAEKALVLGQR
ncbi:MAG: type II secretion system GspH family protein [Lachnospiraceae bacterium]|nr:type II secretion system GspH family protein [Lachnospiraceae bacterium]